jgi:hypothetical protein
MKTEDDCNEVRTNFFTIHYEIAYRYERKINLSAPHHPRPATFPAILNPLSTCLLASLDTNDLGGNTNITGNAKTKISAFVFNTPAVVEC